MSAVGKLHWRQNGSNELLMADDDKYVGHFYIDASKGVDADAVMELIAAAPDLLAALAEAQKALAMIVEPNAIKQSTVINAFAQVMAAEAKARTAIAKAEGKS
jgi:hypothetical protein